MNRQIAALLIALSMATAARAATGVEEVLAQACQSVVKIYGAGGVGRLQGYGSGVLISADGQILTTVSSLLDANPVRVTLSDGRKFSAQRQKLDRSTGLALLKIDAIGLPFLNVQPKDPIGAGSTVYALSNQFNIAVGREPASVQRGIIAGVIQDKTRGRCYVIDSITSNPGSAGGALIDEAGVLVGILAPEHRDVNTNTWINLAYPTREFAGPVLAALNPKEAGTEGDKQMPTLNSTLNRKPSATARYLLEERGIRLVPEVLDRTPAYVDRIVRSTPAERAGILPDDLIVYVGDTLVASIAELRSAIAEMKPGASWRLVVQRDGKLVEITVEANNPPAADSRREANP